MKYREDKYGNKLSILGFGCGQLVRDKPDNERIVLTAIENGVNYFETGYIYPNSEKIIGEIIAKNNKRRDIFLTDKLPLMFCKNTGDFDRYFNEQLKKVQTDYFDYYLMHGIMNFDQWDKLKKLGIEEWITGKKKSGLIRQVGFSFHGSCNDFLKILDSYDWELCQIQYNYYNENHQAGKTGLIAAANKGLPVMIMSPLQGGRLASALPEKAVKIFADADPNLAPGDWAFRWLWNQNGITVVLSSMNTIEQIENNLRSADRFEPLSDEELAVYDDVVKLFRESYKINCTGCNYCMPCARGVNIPGCFSAYNTTYAQGFFAGLLMHITSAAGGMKNKGSPRFCNGCGKCEKLCPQYLPIRQLLKKVSKRIEPLLLRMILAIVRLFIAK